MTHLGYLNNSCTVHLYFQFMWAQKIYVTLNKTIHKTYCVNVVGTSMFNKTCKKLRTRAENAAINFNYNFSVTSPNLLAQGKTSVESWAAGKS